MPTEPTPPMSTPDTDPPKQPPPDPADNGEINNWLGKMFGRSWKTSFSGLVAVGCSVITGLSAALPGQIPPSLAAVAGIIGPMVGGVGLMMAKDHNISGTGK